MNDTDSSSSISTLNISDSRVQIKSAPAILYRNQTHQLQNETINTLNASPIEIDLAKHEDDECFEIFPFNYNDYFRKSKNHEYSTNDSSQALTEEDSEQNSKVLVCDEYSQSPVDLCYCKSEKSEDVELKCQITTFRSTEQDYVSSFNETEPLTYRAIEVPSKRRCLHYEIRRDPYEELINDLEIMKIPQVRSNFKKSISDSCLHRLSVTIGINTSTIEESVQDQSCTVDTHAVVSNMCGTLDESRTSRCCSLSPLSNATPLSSPRSSSPISSPSYCRESCPSYKKHSLDSFLIDEESLIASKSWAFSGSYNNNETQRNYTVLPPENNVEYDEFGYVQTQMSSGSIHSSCLRLNLPPDSNSESHITVISDAETYSVNCDTGQVEPTLLYQPEIDVKPQSSRTGTKLMSSVRKAFRRLGKRKASARVQRFCDDTNTPRRTKKKSGDSGDHELTYFPSEEVMQTVNYSDYMLKTESSNMSLDELMDNMKELIKPIRNSVFKESESTKKPSQQSITDQYFDNLPSISPELQDEVLPKRFSIESNWDNIGSAASKSLMLDQLRTKLKMSGSRVAPSDDSNRESSKPKVNERGDAKTNVFAITDRKEQIVCTKFYDIEAEETPLECLETARRSVDLESEKTPKKCNHSKVGFFEDVDDEIQEQNIKCCTLRFWNMVLFNRKESTTFND